MFPLLKPTYKYITTIGNYPLDYEMKYNIGSLIKANLIDNLFDRIIYKTMLLIILNEQINNIYIYNILKTFINNFHNKYDCSIFETIFNNINEADLLIIDNDNDILKNNLLIYLKYSTSYKNDFQHTQCEICNNLFEEISYNLIDDIYISSYEIHNFISHNIVSSTITNNTEYLLNTNLYDLLFNNFSPLSIQYNQEPNLKTKLELLQIIKDNKL